MEKLTLDFFGEKVSISTPKDLSFLRIQISEKFCFSDVDAAEILIYYLNDNQKTYIINDEDYSTFLTHKASVIYLDIDPNSKLYKDKFLKMEKEVEEKSVELEKLVQKRAEIEKCKEEYLKTYKEQLGLINKQLEIYLSKKTELLNSKKNKMKEFECQKEKIDKKINEITKKEKNLKPDESNNKESDNYIPMYLKVKDALDNVVEKVKEITNEYIFKIFEEAKTDEKEKIANFETITNEAVEEINNLSKLVLRQSKNVNNDNDKKIVLRGKNVNLLANSGDSDLCEKCLEESKHEQDHLTIKITGESSADVHKGVKCKGCGTIIWN